MRTVSIFKNNANQAIHIPKDMQFEGVTVLEIWREGDTILLRPARRPGVIYGRIAGGRRLFDRTSPVLQTDRFDK